jgi:hypothetical protein
VNGFACAALVTAGASTSALAASITLNNTTYDVTTLTGTSTDFATIIPQQPWFGHFSLADSAALQVGTSLGLPHRINNLDWGPAFAQTFNAPPANSSGSFFTHGTAGINIVPTRTYTFAFVTTTIPEPATLSLLAGTAALALRRRPR